jgi:hypothetical protein
MRLKQLQLDIITEFLDYLLEDPEEEDLTTPETADIMTISPDVNVK